ncbi:MAG: Gfo/Idh/MocA family oxidoreductase [Verrucomicrobiota bacterium]
MKKTTRREFIGTASAIAAASAFPRFSIADGDKVSKINVAIVGAGGMGGYAVGEGAGENLVALCDVDEERAAKAFKEHADVPRFRDFRVMLDKMGDDIDAVAISTPDHTHFAPAMAAMERGKHVFIQKPLAHNIWEVRTLQKAAEHYDVITQMGNQGHTFDGMLRIKEWVDAGVIGDVTEVITWTNRPNPPWFIPPDTFPPAESPVPATLDWDLWQGPVAARPFSDAYAPVRWRGWWDYGCGALGDIGCHTFDAPFWVLDLGLPTKVEVERDDPPGEGFIPMSSVVTYHFPARGDKPPVTMKWFEKGHDVPKPKRWDGSVPVSEKGGMYMEGTEETLYHADMRPTSPRLTPDDRFNGLKSTLKEIDRIENQGTGGPIKEWFRAIKGEGPVPGSSFGYAGPLTEVVLLGAMAQRTGKTIEWDAENMSVKGQPELDILIKEPVRQGWEYGENLA